jgi:hypothetical protein
VARARRAARGGPVGWGGRAAADALPVILLDGFDELLQATGLHPSNYLQRVAEFQRREATLDRPVAVLVTSRVAVADRARLPDGGLVVRLEPFDDEQIARWTAVWNATSGDSLDPAALTRLLDQVPDAVTTFVQRPSSPATESVAHCLLRLWLTATSDANRSELIAAYRQAAIAVRAESLVSRKRCAAIVLRSLIADAHRLPPADVLALIDQLTTVPDVS